MSPLDDELRAAFSARAGLLEPSPDPLAGIERRARSIQRRRVAASVAGTALAVSVLAVAVPAVLTGPTQDRDDVVTATQPPTLTPPAPPTSVADRPGNALDWPSRPLTAEDDTALREWATTQRSTATPRGEVLHRAATPLGDEVVAYQLWLPGERAHTVVAQSGEGGPVVLRSSEAVPGQTTVDAVVAGGETPYVLVVGQPGTTQVQYAADGDSFADVPTADRAALFARTGPDGPAPDRIRLLGPDGQPTRPASIWAGPAEGEPGAAREGGPANRLDWPTRGDADPALVREAEAAFARELGRTGQAVRSEVLFGGRDDDGRAYVLLQAWTQGDDAYTLGYTTGPGREPRLALRGKTEPDAPVLAVLVPAGPGQTTDTLVLVPRPGTAQLQYGESPAQLRVVDRPAALGGVALVDRRPGASDDVVRTLDAEGQTAFDGRVVNLLCTLRGCD